MRSTHQAGWLQLVLALMISGTGLQAQSAPSQIPANRRQLVGVVRDARGATVPDVNVAIPGSSTRTNARGAFELFTVETDTVTISLRRIGFEPVDALLSARNRMWDTVVVQLEPTAVVLDKVDITENRTRKALGLRSFEERRSLGLGTYITRADIVERGSFKLSDLLRSKRGVNVIRGGKVRFASHSSGARGTLCQPDIWLDGVRSLPMEIDELPSSTVEAIELYPYFSTVPIEFQRVGANTTPCGTIAVWSRVPNAKNK
jgi:hypothetical protein